MNNLILVRLLESFFRRPFLSLLPLFALTAAGVFLFQRATPTYISFAGIVVRDEFTDKGFWETIAEASAAEVQEMLSSDSLVEQILARTTMADLVGNPEFTREEVHNVVRDNVWVEAVADRRFVILARADNPETALELAQAAYETFVDWHNQQALLNAEANVAFFQDEMAKVSAELTEAQDEERDFRIAVPEPVRGERPESEQLTLNELRTKVGIATQRFNKTQSDLTVSQQILQWLSTEEFQPYLLVDAPAAALKPITSVQEEALKIVFAFIAGLIASFGFVAANAILNRACMYPQDVRHGLGVELLAVLPDDLEHRDRIKYMPEPVSARRPVVYKPIPLPHAKDELPTMVLPKLSEQM